MPKIKLKVLKLNEKITKIKCEQLLGIEKRSDIYLLAVLNMILMGMDLQISFIRIA